MTLPFRGGLAPFTMRFDLRNPGFTGRPAADGYAAALEMAEWADRVGFEQIFLSEHHGAADGYLPSPLTMLAALAARTERVQLSVAALIAPFHDPLRLAEDVVVVDNISRGRIELVLAAGYLPAEFTMVDVPLGERVARVTEAVTTLKAAFTGEECDFRGRRVRVTPPPCRLGGPPILLGGSSAGAAPSRRGSGTTTGRRSCGWGAPTRDRSRRRAGSSSSRRTRRRPGGSTRRTCSTR